MIPSSDPHAGQTIVKAGPPADEAAATLILLHGRGATAESMLDLYEAFNITGLAVLAPQAASNTWYPQSFLAPLEANQPYLDSALRRVSSIVEELIEAGLRADQIALLGFSQGACLTCEFVARNPRKYGAVMALTGGLIGPPGTLRSYGGSLDGVPLFLGTSDPDMHVPFDRVEETRDVFADMGADVELRRYPGMPHTVNEDEIEMCRNLLRRLIQGTAG